MSRAWAPEEDALLREHYPSHGSSWDGWAWALPGRGSASISSHARKLGLRVESHARWSPSEEFVLERHFPVRGARWDGWERLLPGRSRHSIRQHALALGLRSFSDARRWTDDERRDLLEGLLALSKACGHSPAECVCEAARLAAKRGATS